MGKLWGQTFSLALGQTKSRVTAFVVRPRPLSPGTSGSGGILRAAARLMKGPKLNMTWIYGNGTSVNLNGTEWLIVSHSL